MALLGIIAYSLPGSLHTNILINSKQAGFLQSSIHSQVQNTEPGDRGLHWIGSRHDLMSPGERRNLFQTQTELDVDF